MLIKSFAVGFVLVRVDLRHAARSCAAFGGSPFAKDISQLAVALEQLAVLEHLQADFQLAGRRSAPPCGLSSASVNEGVAERGGRLVDGLQLFSADG
jgi:hypothetical protein